MSPGGELKPREGIDCHCIRFDSGHIAESNVRTGLAQHRADALAEPGQVGGRERTADSERDRLRR